MNSKSIGADMGLCMAKAEIGMMDAKTGSKDHVRRF